MRTVGICLEFVGNPRGQVPENSTDNWTGWTTYNDSICALLMNSSFINIFLLQKFYFEMFRITRYPSEAGGHLASHGTTRTV